VTQNKQVKEGNKKTVIALASAAPFSSFLKIVLRSLVR